MPVCFRYMTEQLRKENIELTPRLFLIAERVPCGARFADVGTDHGHLPLYLLREGRISSAIASDIRPGPLEHAKENAAFHGLSNHVRFVLAGGLDGISARECDTIAIAGMGGETIAEILSAAPWTRKGEHLLLLQPMTSIYELRQWLWSHGYGIEEEAVCREGRRNYVVLSVRGTGGPDSAPRALFDCCVSAALLRAPGAREYLEHLLAREQWAFDGMRAGQSIEPAVLEEQRRLVENLRRAWEEITCQS